jgi:ketosteroid isomerase-like protein
VTVEGEEAVRAFLVTWESAWERMDLPAYLGHYSSDRFRSKVMGVDAWGRKKTAIWAVSGFIEVELEELSVVINNKNAEVRFLQTYRSRTLGDRGRKTLGLVLEDGGWKIVKEVWRP